VVVGSFIIFFHFLVVVQRKPTMINLGKTGYQYETQYQNQYENQYDQQLFIDNDESFRQALKVR